MVSWKPDSGLVTNFDFDFDRHALCGIKPGDPVSLLWKLGPPENRDAEASGNCNYYSRGVQASVEQGKIVSFVLFWNDKDQKQFLSFNGPCTYHGQVIALRAGLSEAEVASIFGEPYWRNEDREEIILFYEFGDVEWQIEIARTEGLTAIVAFAGRPVFQMTRSKEKSSK